MFDDDCDDDDDDDDVVVVGGDDDHNSNIERMINVTDNCNVDVKRCWL